MNKFVRFVRTAHDVEWIPVSQLSVVWVNAQRAFNEKHAKNIGANFDPDMFEPVKVTLPNGEGVYHIIDGQHRVAAVKMFLGEDQQVPAQVVKETDPSRAAKLFLNINTARKRPSAIDVFKVRVTAQDETAVGVSKIIKKFGYRISAAKDTNCISAVNALMFIYDQWGAPVLEDTLKIIQATWGTDTNAVVSEILRGYGAFIAEYGATNKLNFQRIKEVIEKQYTPGRFLAQVKAVREANKISTTEAAKETIAKSYNRGLKDSLKISVDRKSH